MLLETSSDLLIRRRPTTNISIFSTSLAPFSREFFPIHVLYIHFIFQIKPTTNISQPLLPPFQFIYIFHPFCFNHHDQRKRHLRSCGSTCASLRGFDLRLWLRPLVEDIHPRTVQWHKPFCVSFCSTLPFHFISSNNPYTMNFRFLAADSLQKFVILVALFLCTTFTKWGSIDWSITLFSLSTLPKHSSWGSLFWSHVWRIHTRPHNPNRGLAKCHLVHSFVVPFLI